MPVHAAPTRAPARAFAQQRTRVGHVGATQGDRERARCLASDRGHDDHVRRTTGRLDGDRQAPVGPHPPPDANPAYVDVAALGEIIGGTQSVEQRRQAEIEDVIQHENIDAHGRNDIIVVVLASGARSPETLDLPAKEEVHRWLMYT